MADHKYADLANKLRMNIKSGVYNDGQKLPSENELADRTGYSRQTVRQAIGLLESEGLAERVQGSGTFVRLSAAPREKTDNIAVVTTYISEYIFPTILDGIEQELAENGYTSMLSITRNRIDNERRILQMLLKKPIDGMIVEGTKTALPNPNIDLYEKFVENGVPVVFIHGFYQELKNPVYVVADDRAGGYMACERLLKAGHQRIAGIFKSDDMQGHRRYAGFTEALRNAGLVVEDNHVLWYTTENQDSMLAACMMETLHDCTAAVCYNDEIALKTIEILQQNHSSVPDRMELISFDNSIYAQMSPVPFLSLNSPKERLGRMAAQKIIGLLNGEAQMAAVLPWSIETEN